MRVDELEAGVSLESNDGLVITLVERRNPSCWLCLVLADFYPGAKATEGFVVPLVFQREVVEDDGWKVLWR